jgi:hypothetical protein
VDPSASAKISRRYVVASSAPHRIPSSRAKISSITTGSIRSAARIVRARSKYTSAVSPERTSAAVWNRGVGRAWACSVVIGYAV